MTAVSLALCILFLCMTYCAGKKSIVLGLLSALAVGYVFGILRANVLSPFSHFLFDSALIGFYLSQTWSPLSQPERASTHSIRQWLLILVVWPTLLCLVPFQSPLVTLVGYRGNVFFLPILLFAARLDREQWRRLALGLAVLNIIAVGFAALEYFRGVPAFFPVSPVTAIIYNSRDVAGYTAFRIPATFSNAHSYGGTVTSTLPLLLAGWTNLRSTAWQKILLLAGCCAAMFGILLSSTRVHFVIAAVVIGFATIVVKMRPGIRLIWCLAIAVVAFSALHNSRMQRFKSIEGTDTITDRVSGSVNRSFLEVAYEYPMGNGLGGGGTSIPYFLASQLRRPVSIESEFARFLLEEGLPGLLLWVAFFVWSFTRKESFRDSGKRTGWVCTICYVFSAMIGTGLLTAVPQTMLLLLQIGWITTPEIPEHAGATEEMFARGWQPETA
jgi:hypothetical protein